MEGIRLEGVSVGFGNVAALDDVTLEVRPGERVAVIGASGAGKSTIFGALTRSVALRRGRVLLGGCDLYALSRRDLRDLRRRVGTIYQAYNLVPQLSAGSNVALGRVREMGVASTLRTFLAGPDAELSRWVRGALEEVGLGEKAGTRTADLSGGQQQRVAVARLLVQRPDWILADEPFAAVDPVTTERVLEALLDLNRAGATVLLNLHDVELARRFPRVVALRAGRVAFDGPSEELTEGVLREVYAGDPYAPDREVSAAPAGQRDGVRLAQPVRIAEGRDGISSH